MIIPDKRPLSIETASKNTPSPAITDLAVSDHDFYGDIYAGEFTGDEVASLALDQSTGRTDAANAKRLAAVHGRNLKYCPKWNKWIVWDGKRWKIDGGCYAEMLAKKVADLFGKRFCTANETAEGRRLAEVTVKQLTGCDRLKARRMREDHWQFAPTHKIWLCGNHQPKIVGDDPAIWDRIRLISFNIRIATHEQDKQLGEKLRAEASGILNWAIAGCLDWLKNGLLTPPVVQTATKKYQAEEDFIATWFDERIEKADRGSFTTATDLYEDYDLWHARLYCSHF